MAYVYTACTVHVTISSTGGKFRPVANFMELHALTLAAHSYALLMEYMKTAYKAGDAGYMSQLKKALYWTLPVLCL